MFLTCYFNVGFSQIKNDCNPTLDSLEVIKIIQKKGLLLLPKGYTIEEVAKYPSIKPLVTFNPQNCVWTVISKSYNTTKKGKCKNTNGCTIEIAKTVLVSEKTRKIISKMITKTLIENYE